MNRLALMVVGAWLAAALSYVLFAPLGAVLHVGAVAMSVYAMSVARRAPEPLPPVEVVQPPPLVIQSRLVVTMDGDGCAYCHTPYEAFDGETRCSTCGAPRDA